MAATTRLAVWIAISTVVHLFMALSINLRVASRLAGPEPLLVEIQRAVQPELDAEITVPGSSDHAGIAAAATPPAETLPQAQSLNSAAAREAAVQLDLPLDKYFTAREVDVRASQINEVVLIYPQRAYELRLKGKVVLRIFINENGGTDMISVLAAMPPGVFEEVALTAARELEFSPAIKNGRHVKSQKTIEVVFDPYERINIP